MSLLPFMPPIADAGGGITVNSITQPSSAYLEDLSAQAVASSFTLAGRFKPLNITTRKFLLGDYNNIYLRIENTGAFTWKCEDEFGTAFISGATSALISGGNWYNYLLHFNNDGSTELWLDGVSVKTNTATTANDLNVGAIDLFNRAGGVQAMEADHDFVWCNWGDSVTMSSLYDALFTGEDASANTAIHGDLANETGIFDSITGGFYLRGTVANWNGVGSTSSPVGTATKTGTFTQDY